MFQGLFGWLRNSVRAAIIGGVQDAMNEIATAEADAPDAPALRLTFRPVAEPDAAPAKKRKAE